MNSSESLFSAHCVQTWAGHWGMGKLLYGQPQAVMGQELVGGWIKGSFCKKEVSGVRIMAGHSLMSLVAASAGCVPGQLGIQKAGSVHNPF